MIDFDGRGSGAYSLDRGRASVRADELPGRKSHHREHVQR